MRDKGNALGAAVAMDCEDEDTFREAMRNIAKDAEYLFRRAALVFCPGRRVRMVHVGELLTFMPGILIDSLLRESEEGRREVRGLFRRVTA